MKIQSDSKDHKHQCQYNSFKYYAGENLTEPLIIVWVYHAKGHNSQTNDREGKREASIHSKRVARQQESIRNISETEQ